MNDYQNGTFNTIARGTTAIGGGIPVWARVNKCYQGGGWIDTTSLAPGTIIPAGTPVIFQGPGRQVIVVKTTDTDALPKVNGLTFNDVCIPAGVMEATCAGVHDGRIYASRAAGGEGLPASLMAQLPAIEFVYEGPAPDEPSETTTDETPESKS